MKKKKGNKTWFEESGIPASQVTELDWWDHITLPTQPGSDQELKFVCTPAQHKSGACPPIHFLSSFSPGNGTNKNAKMRSARSRLYGLLDDALG